MEDLASEEEGAAIDRPCKSALVRVQLVEKGCRCRWGGPGGLGRNETPKF